MAGNEGCVFIEGHKELSVDTAKRSFGRGDLLEVQEVGGVLIARNAKGQSGPVSEAAKLPPYSIPQTVTTSPPRFDILNGQKYAYPGTKRFTAREKFLRADGYPFVFTNVMQAYVPMPPTPSKSADANLATRPKTSATTGVSPAVSS